MSTNGNGTGPRLGSWARTGGLVGLVARNAGGQVTLFNPGTRQSATVATTEVELVPAAAVTVTATVDVPLAHGVEENEVRRWVASLLDPTLRERAQTALAEASLDAGAALPEVRFEVSEAATSGAVCLCGARAPAPLGASVACPRCDRQAVTAPPPGGPR